MSVLHSNHSYFQPAEHTFFRSYEKCQGNCDCSFDETELVEYQGYKLCSECLEEWQEDDMFRMLMLGVPSIEDEN